MEDVTVLGWSMGASILWSYIELFGNHRISGLICVDQSPAQYTGTEAPGLEKIFLARKRSSLRNPVICFSGRNRAGSTGK